ncbi:hypothetical protein EK904_001948 [Melospiza melodia maxima]|nr:hypothetical protein EK904_001948 [Melospiza melodia maxima]
MVGVNKKQFLSPDCTHWKGNQTFLLKYQTGFEILCILFDSGTASEMKAQSQETPLSMAFVSRLLHALLCQAQSWLLLHVLPSFLVSVALCQVFHINQKITHS